MHRGSDGRAGGRAAGARRSATGSPRRRPGQAAGHDDETQDGRGGGGRNRGGRRGRGRSEGGHRDRGSGGEGEGLAGRVVPGAPRGEAPPSIPSYGVIWEERLTRSGAPRDEAGWTWLRNHGVRSVVNFRFLPEDQEASERARFEHYLSLPFKGKEPPTEAEAETFLAFVRDPHYWPVHIHCK